MFRGATLLNLDAKGRLVMPTRYRDALLEICNGHLVLTIDLHERCLQLYPEARWREIESKINELPSFDKSARRAQRLLIGHANELEMDAAGRLSIPSVLRSFAFLDKKIMLVGQGYRFEVWSEERWNQQVDGMLAEDSDGSSLSEQMLKLVL